MAKVMKFSHSSKALKAAFFDLLDNYWLDRKKNFLLIFSSSSKKV